MLCSAKELGLGELASGLLELPHTSQPGQDVRELLALNDHVIEIDLTPNRGDCLSIAGIAREVGALNRLPVSPVRADPVVPQIDDSFAVTIADPADCPRYVGRIVRGVDPTAASPLWLTERLRRAGIRSLGPLVDVTNYVMLELGQPLHAFDLAKLCDGIAVRRARPGEQLTLLNGQVIDLQADTLLITDASGPIGLAGIMGGANSECDDSTRDVFLESAFFSPTSIIGRARHYGLHTDASHRFERGVDPGLQTHAIERATRLLLDIAGGQPGPLVDTVDAERLPQPGSILLRPQRIETLLGLALDKAEIEDNLVRLGMSITTTADGWQITPPSFRFDITREADLIEELGRVHGYNRLPSHRPAARLQPGLRPEGELSPVQLRAALVQRDYQEVISYSFIPADLQRLIDPEQPAVPLSNPISAEMAVMRTSLWPGLLQTLDRNRNRQQERIRLFEIGLNFRGGLEQLTQELYLGGLATGLALPEQWATDRRRADFYDIKGDLEALLVQSGRNLGIDFIAARHPALHPGQSARLECGGANAGWLGALHPKLARQLQIDGIVYLFELRVAGLMVPHLPPVREPSRFPHSRRDLAVVVSESVTAGALVDTIRAQGGELLQQITLFDVYRGKGIPEDHKSMAFGLTLQDFTGNLTDEAVDACISRIVEGLEQQLGARLRD